MPVSRTLETDPHGALVDQGDGHSTSPRSVNLMALLTRLTSTWPRRQRIRAGSPGHGGDLLMMTSILLALRQIREHGGQGVRSCSLNRSRSPPGSGCRFHLGRIRIINLMKQQQVVRRGFYLVEIMSPAAADPGWSTRRGAEADDNGVHGDCGSCSVGRKSLLAGPASRHGGRSLSFWFCGAAGRGHPAKW